MGLILTGYLPQLVLSADAHDVDSTLSLVENACNSTVFKTIIKLGLNQQLRPEGKAMSTDDS